MSKDVLVMVEHQGEVVSDSSSELLGKAKELAGAWGGQVVAAVFGAPGVLERLGVTEVVGAEVIKVVEHPMLEQYTPEAYERALEAVAAEVEPRLVLTSTATVGLDLAGAMSVAWDAPLVSYVVGLVARGDGVTATAQIYGGKLLAEVALEADRMIATVIAGSFPPDTGQSVGSARVDKVQVGDLDGLRVGFLFRSEPDTSGVDITSADVLVSVGRGIGSAENLDVVRELADALGVPLSASRPVIDQGWLPKPHQVGKSGKKVKPRAYLALGISGAPEHLEGMKDAELIIACNTDANAPIFDVAHYGTVLDLFELVPALVEAIEG